MYGGEKGLKVFAVLVSEKESPIPSEVVASLRLLIAEARKRGWSGSVVPHSSIVNTPCPGKALTKLIKDGVFV